MVRLPSVALGTCIILSLTTQNPRAQSSLQQKTEFIREVNRYRWEAVTGWNAQLGLWKIDMTNQFISDAYLQFNQRLRFRDEDQLNLTVLRSLSPRYAFMAEGDLNWFGAGRASSQSLLLGIQMIPSTSLEFKTALGLASDRRPGIEKGSQENSPRVDTGPAASMSINMVPREIQGYRVSFRSSATWKHISPRRAGDIMLEGAATRSFGPATMESGARFSARRRDTYQATSFLNREQLRAPESVEATTSDTLDANFLIQTPVLKVFQVVAQVDVRVNRRRIRAPGVPQEFITFETNFVRQALNGQVGLYYQRERIDAELRAEYGAVNERRILRNNDQLPPSEAAQKRILLRQADYDEGVFALSGRFRGEVFPALSILFTGSSRIVRHDTPTVNRDDRDEVYHTASLALSHRRSRYLRVELRLFGSHHHTVFLNAARSAENSIQRTLRLRPSMEWTPDSQTRIQLSSEVRATYTTEDFVLPGRRPSDQSAREMRLESDMEHRLFADTDLKWSASFSDLRLGRLKWDSFTEVPFDTLRTYSAWLRIQSGHRIRGELGWRIFLRSDYDRAVTVQFRLPDGVTTGSLTRTGKRWILQSGPSGAIYWIRGQTTLRLDAWANWQQLRYRLYGQLPSTSAEVIQQAARRGTRRLIPLVSLRMLWSL